MTTEESEYRLILRWYYSINIKILFVIMLLWLCREMNLWYIFWNIQGWNIMMSANYLQTVEQRWISQHGKMLTTGESGWRVNRVSVPFNFLIFLLRARLEVRKRKGKVASFYKQHQKLRVRWYLRDNPIQTPCFTDRKWIRSREREIPI